MNIKRYSRHYLPDGGFMAEDPEGQYVKYEDHMDIIKLHGALSAWNDKASNHRSQLLDILRFVKQEHSKGNANSTEVGVALKRVDEILSQINV